MLQADFAAAPLTITSFHEQVVDFTRPFMNLGFTVLLKRPHRDTAPGVYPLWFLEPLAPAVWGLLAIAILAVRPFAFKNAYNI